MVNLIITRYWQVSCVNNVRKKNYLRSRRSSCCLYCKVRIFLQFLLFSFIAMAQQSIILMFRKSNDRLGNPVQDKNWLRWSESRNSVPLQSCKLYYLAISSCLSCLPCPPVNQVRCFQSCLVCRGTISYLVFAFICVDKRHIKV